MPSEFKTGDLVRVKPNARAVKPGIYEVTSIIRPAQEGEAQYVLRSCKDESEKTVPARQVARA